MLPLHKAIQPPKTCDLTSHHLFFILLFYNIFVCKTDSLALRTILIGFHFCQTLRATHPLESENVRERNAHSILLIEL